MAAELPLAPEWNVSGWLGGEPRTLASLRGRVVVLHAFQMLCPGCVSHGLPQASRIHELFPRERVVVVGLHSVFEHHEVMTPKALEAFVSEYRWPFPIAIDAPGPDGVPLTMRAYELRGTPSLVVIDAEGRIAAHWFGRPDDMKVGAAIASLPIRHTSARDAACSDDGCPLPDQAAVRNMASP